MMSWRQFVEDILTKQVKDRHYVFVVTDKNGNEERIKYLYYPNYVRQKFIEIAKYYRNDVIVRAYIKDSGDKPHRLFAVYKGNGKWEQPMKDDAPFMFAFLEE